MTFWFRIVFTWWLDYFTSHYLKVHFMLIKCTYDSKSRTLRMRCSFQSTSRLISRRNGWSFRVYMIPLRDFVPEWNSRPGATTGVNSRRGDSHWHDFLWWYHVNKCRAMRGNRSKLAVARKSPQCHVNTPLCKRFLLFHQINLHRCQPCKWKGCIDFFACCVWTYLHVHTVYGLAFHESLHSSVGYILAFRILEVMTSNPVRVSTI